MIKLLITHKDGSLQELDIFPDSLELWETCLMKMGASWEVLV